MTMTSNTTTSSLHDALPISRAPAPSPSTARSPWPGGRSGAPGRCRCGSSPGDPGHVRPRGLPRPAGTDRSEEHTSELQSREKLVCRLLPEKKKQEENIVYYS